MVGRMGSKNHPAWFGPYLQMMALNGLWDPFMADDRAIPNEYGICREDGDLWSFSVVFLPALGGLVSAQPVETVRLWSKWL